MRHPFPVYALICCAVLPATSVNAQTRAEVIVSATREFDFRLENGVRHEVIPPPRATLLIDSTRWQTDGNRRVYARDLSFVVDSAGQLRELVRLPLRLTPRMDTAQLRRFEQRRFVAGELVVSIPELVYARAFRALPPSARPGQQWRARVVERHEHLGVSENETGMRTTTYLRDSIVNGVPVWVLRDSTEVVRAETWPAYGPAIRDSALHHRQAAGYRLATFLYDPARSIVIQRWDTVVTRGPLQREFSPTRTYRTTQDFIGVSMLLTELPAAFDVRQQIARDSASRVRGGMVIVAGNPLERGLLAGERRLLDSLVTVWSRTPRIADRQRIESMMLMWWRRTDPDWRSLLFTRALADGDTSTAYRLARPVVMRRLDEHTLRFLLPYLADPERALRAGLPLDPGYNELYSTLTGAPPAVAAHDSLAACDRVTCPLIERYLNDASVDPRLRDLAAITRFLREPRENFQLLSQRAQQGGVLAQRALRFAQGYRSDAADAAPLPGPGASWTAWRDWSRTSGGSLALVQLLTGRDFGAEFRERFNAATNDSAQLVFGNLLISHDPDAFSVEHAIALFESNSTVLERLGESVLARTLRGEAELAPPDVAEPLLDALIAHLVDGTPPPWNTNPRQSAPRNEPLVIVSDSIPAGVADRWRGKVRMVTTAEWRAADVRAGTHYVVFTHPRVVGPFVQLSFRINSSTSVSPDQAPRHYASGQTITLMRTSAGWRVVSEVGWVT